MENYYTLLGLPANSDQAAIDEAYRRQRDRYALNNLAELGPDLQSVAQQRLAAIDHAYQVLGDPQRRGLYDQQLNQADGATVARTPRRTLSRRDVLFGAGGVLAGLVLVALVWVFAGQTATPELPPVGEVNRPAPEFDLLTLDGERVRLSDFRGQVVLVNFWGTWCEPCKEETPDLQAVYERLGEQGLVVVGVNLFYSEETRYDAQARAKVAEFIRLYSVTYPIVLDQTGAVANDYRIYPIPTSFFIDQFGTIRYVTPRPITADEVEVIFTQLQQEAAMGQ